MDPNAAGSPFLIPRGHQSASGWGVSVLLRVHSAPVLANNRGGSFRTFGPVAPHERKSVWTGLGGQEQAVAGLFGNITAVGIACDTLDGLFQVALHFLVDEVLHAVCRVVDVIQRQAQVLH